MPAVHDAAHGVGVGHARVPVVTEAGELAGAVRPAILPAFVSS